MFVRLGDSEGNVAHEGAVSPQDDGEVDLFTTIELALMGAYPILCHPILVRMGDQESSGGDVPVPDRSMDVRSVGEGEGPENQAG